MVCICNYNDVSDDDRGANDDNGGGNDDDSGGGCGDERARVCCPTRRCTYNTIFFIIKLVSGERTTTVQACPGYVIRLFCP